MSYDLTAAENIGLGDVDARSTARRGSGPAAGRAGIARRVAALPRGYDTLLSPDLRRLDEGDDPDRECCSPAGNGSGWPWPGPSCATGATC